MTKNIKLEKIDTISYWRYVKLKKCFGYGAYPFYLRPKVKIPDVKTKSLVVGLFYHSLLERLNSLSVDELRSAEKFNHIFNELLEEFKRDLASSTKNRYLAAMSKWPEVNQIYQSVFRYFSDDLKKKNKGAFKAEQELTSKDGLITGNSDAYIVDGSHISLIDYKSSDFTGESVNIEEYKKQLYLYAYLLEEKYGVYPVSLSLVDRRSNLVRIAPAPTISMEIADEMRGVLSNYNKAINIDSNLYSNARASVESCKYCKLKSDCRKFWEEKDIHSEIGEYNHIVVGTQVNEIKKTKSGSCVINIRVEKATVPADETSVGKLFIARFPFLKDIPGQKLVLTNLKNTSGSSFSAEFTDQSIISAGE